MRLLAPLEPGPQIRRRRDGWLAPLGRERGPSRMLARIRTLFPGYLDGSRLDCAVPPAPEWHMAVGAVAGVLVDCGWPAPGGSATGPYAPFDCTTEIPA